MLIKSMSFSYKKRDVLHDLSLEIQPGAICGIAGHNGAGKTTLLRLMAGILKPTSGSIEKVPDDSVSYLPERAGLYDELTVAQNIKVSGMLSGMTRREAENIIDTALRKWHLTEQKHSLVKQLSTGQRQRVGFICASFIPSTLVLCDEPTLGVDAYTRELIEQEIRSMQENGKTIILVSHDLEFIRHICTQFVVINDGQIVHDSRLGPDDQIEELYLQLTREDAE